jgi:hypothetical protein
MTLEEGIRRLYFEASIPLHRETMMIKSKQAVTILASLIALLVLLATLASVLNPGEPTSGIQSMDARGNPYEVQGSGLYKYDPHFLVVEAIAWDTVNLVLGVPLLLLGIVLFSQGRLRGTLLLAGLLFYFLYVEIMYATMMALNWLFLVYVAIFALCWVTLMLILPMIDIQQLAAAVSKRFPRKAFAVYAFVLAVILLVLWSGRIVPAIISGQLPAGMEGLTTFETQALDLGLMVPMMILTSILLWKQLPWGYFLAGISVTAGFMMFVAIPMMVLAAARRRRLCAMGGNGCYGRDDRHRPGVPGALL